ncbi:MAG: hypothetical protein GEV07_24110 [Streptosporangiales bacterium]|nr:hypothetical protein [Streptosporangiales bacterium]
MSAAGMMRSAGLSVDPYRGPAGFVAAGGRMYADLTAVVRSKKLRKDLPQRMQIQGPRVAAAVERLLTDPRFSTQPGLPFRPRSMVRAAARYAGPVVAGTVRALARPDAARARAYRIASELEHHTTAPAGELPAAERLEFVETVPRDVLGRRMTGLIGILIGGLGASDLPRALLGPYAEPGDLDAVLRGMPHNPTTEMDLELWRLARAAEDVRDVLLVHPPAELAARYRDGSLPDIGLTEFLAKYGRRAVAEIDVGVPRWVEDPTPVFAVIANYLRVTDPEQAPDRRFAQAAAEAEAKLVELVERAKPRRPVRARLAGFFMRRARAIAGLRELPKFCSLHGFQQMREQLLAVGAELADRGLLDRADDIMFLDFPEAKAAVAGSDLRELVAQRREVHEREMRRRHVPMVLLSDGTEPESELAPRVTADGALVGMAASPGVVTGPARVIVDPAGAHLEPGEILVAPSTDPGWTPLFLTAGGLVTETGAPNSHGPTVAREYGIPAVIGVPAATTTIRSGQHITVDGYTGTVTVTDEPVSVG